MCLAASLLVVTNLTAVREAVGGRTLEQYLHRPAYELFDLEKDPHEMKNVADDPAYADVLKDLRSQLMARLKETNDPWLEGGE